MKIKKFMTPEMYVERVEGSEEWYLGVAFEEDVCDLFEAEMMEKEEKDFMGNCPYFFHYYICLPIFQLRYICIFILQMYFLTIIYTVFLHLSSNITFSH